MTGRDLIIYILENGLEDEPVVKDGRFIGLMSVLEAAEKMNVGTATVMAWMAEERLDGMYVSSGVYIPANAKSPIKCTKV